MLHWSIWGTPFGIAAQANWPVRVRQGAVELMDEH